MNCINCKKDLVPGTDCEQCKPILEAQKQTATVEEPVVSTDSVEEAAVEAPVKRTRKTK